VPHRRRPRGSAAAITGSQSVTAAPAAGQSSRSYGEGYHGHKAVPPTRPGHSERVGHRRTVRDHQRLPAHHETMAYQAITKTSRPARRRSTVHTATGKRARLNEWPCCDSTGYELKIIMDATPTLRHNVASRPC
jgi:hypothetical protein